MEIIYWLAGALAVFLVFGYFRMPLIWWTLAAGLMLWYLSVIAGFAFTANIIMAGAFAAVALALNVAPVRRALITNRVLGKRFVSSSTRSCHLSANSAGDKCT